MTNPFAPAGTPIPTHSDDQPSTHLQRGALGVVDILFFVVAAAAPLMVMAGVAPLAILFGGVGAPAAYLVTGVILLLFSSGFTAMTPYIRNAGAFYAYISRGLGRPAGVGAALLALFSYNAMQIGTYGAFGYFASSTANNIFGLDQPWWVYSFAALAFVWLLGYRSINMGAKVLAALLVAETAILLVLAVAVLIDGGASGLTLDSFAPSNVFRSEMSIPLLMAVAAFIGYEATAIYREEARDPDRTVPKATYAAVAFLTLFYTFITWILVQAFGSDKVVAAAAANPVELPFTAMTEYVGSWATDVQRVLVVTSLLAALLAFHNAITRYAYALSAEQVLPPALGRVHLSHGSPYVAGILQTVLAGGFVAAFALAGADPYTEFFIWVNTPGIVGILVLQVLASFAVVFFFRRNAPQRGEGPLRTTVAPAVAGLLLAGTTVLVCKRLGLLTSAGPSVNWTLITLTPVVFVTGVLLALRLRRRQPAVYDRLATTEIDAA
ncbi:APC family permease [Streptomyces adustus]|uniref:APC family permease n=1 Tax=Streptomyces adustus TaxID=1609272 RepID=UPI00372275A9